mmetsp:Transcript_91963/g.264596  ORF Transcript_91963/g.264596 Transcript_91963/m.264596 type:complete len:358 (-) Transcript_91963:156-1229(-)
MASAMASSDGRSSSPPPCGKPTRSTSSPSDTRKSSLEELAPSSAGDAARPARTAPAGEAATSCNATLSIDLGPHAASADVATWAAPFCLSSPPSASTTGVGPGEPGRMRDRPLAPTAAPAAWGVPPQTSTPSVAPPPQLSSTGAAMPLSSCRLLRPPSDTSSSPPHATAELGAAWRSVSPPPSTLALPEAPPGSGGTGVPSSSSSGGSSPLTSSAPSSPSSPSSSVTSSLPSGTSVVSVDNGKPRRPPSRLVASWQRSGSLYNSSAANSRAQPLEARTAHMTRSRSARSDFAAKRSARKFCITASSTISRSARSGSNAYSSARQSCITAARTVSRSLRSSAGANSSSCQSDMMTRFL